MAGNISRHLGNPLLMLIIGVGLQACASLSGPDLQRLHRQSKPVIQPPVIVLHGVMGAHLVDRVSGKEAWFGSVARLLLSDYANLALEINPQTLQPEPSPLQASGLTREIAGRDYYGNITETLEKAGAYRPAIAGERRAKSDRVYYVLAYDWRQDNVITAGLLADLVDQIKKDFADPDLKVDLVAHSMGGLVARYYLRYGRVDLLDGNDFPVNYHGARNVRRTILLGTPNLGSVRTLHAFITGMPIGLRRAATETLVTMPSIYQLFPHSLNQWLITTSGKPLDRDVFDVRIWRRFQWSIFDPKVRQRIIRAAADEAAGQARLELLERYFEKHLERARRFVWSLTVPLPGEHHRLIVFGGDCQLTPAKLLVEEVDGVSEIRLRPGNIKNPIPGIDYDALMLEPGDGTVTKASLLAREFLDPSIPRHRYIDFPLHYPMFLCEQHEAITGNKTFQDNLLHSLLSIDPGF